MLILMQLFLVRLKSRKQMLIIYITMSVLAVIAGVYLSDQKTTLRVAIQEGVVVPSSSSLDVIVVKERIKTSELLLQKYDAYLYEEDHVLQIDTIKGNEAQAQLASLLKGETQSMTPQRGKGRTILGYVMMFVLMQSIMYLMLFGKDKEDHLLTRLQATPMRKTTYVGATILFASIMTFLPVFSCLFICQMLKVDIGFSLICFAGLLFLLSLLGVSVSFLVSALIHSTDSASMITSAIFVVTSALSGCFLSLQTSTFLSAIIQLLPQKQLMDLASQLEVSGWNMEAGSALLYLICFIAICMLLAVLRCKRIFQMR